MDERQDSDQIPSGGTQPPSAAASLPDSAARVLESITDAFFTLDTAWRFTYINDRADRLMTRGRGEVLGQALWDVFPAARGSVFEREYRRAVADNVPVSFEEHYPPLDAWIEVRAFPSHEGLAVFFQNITDRKRDEEARQESERRFREAEAALRESERLRRAALAGAPMVLWAMNAEGLITLAEGSGLARAGVTSDNYVGRWVFDLSEDETLRAAWRRALAGEDAAYDTANGGVLFHNDLRPQRDADGTVTGVIGVAFDVTEREAATAALRESAERQRALLREVLAGVTGDRLRLVETEAEMPAPLADAGEAIPLTREEGLRELRERVRDAAETLRFPAQRRMDMMTAASEAGMNAVTHGGGRGEGQVSADGVGTVQVRVQDWGAGISPQDLPRAALSRGWSSTESLGHGLAMMLQAVDRLWLLTSAGGTLVVMEQGREEPLPPWL